MQLKVRIWQVMIWFLFIGTALHAQLSSDSRISVITCGPGEDLYSTFGHSAFRVQDPANGVDLVFNYGTFNFNTPNFYLKFARGKLLYSLSRQQFEDFLYSYQLENRWVKEQLLQLSLHQRNELFRFLETNYQPENREYQYDFLFNNCSTKIPEVLSDVLEAQLTYGEDHLDNRYTFRQLIHQYLNINSWSSLGIDVALGAVIDRRAGVYEHMFLPDYVYRQLNHTTLNASPLVSREREILKAAPHNNTSYFTLTPVFWLSMALLFTIAITYIDYKNASRSKAFDFIMFLLTGTVGLLIIFLWFFTDHTATAWNMNILWAFPVNLFLAVSLLRTHSFPANLDKFLLFLMGMLLIIPFLWILQIQVFSPLVMMVFLCLSLRYAYLYRYIKFQNQPKK